MATTENGLLGFLAVVAIGIGGMVGGGIFAVLGLAVQLVHGGTPVAFLLAGIVALLTADSATGLSVTLPSQGGTVEFLNQGFGVGVVTGALNILLWISYVIAKDCELPEILARTVHQTSPATGDAPHSAVLSHLGVLNVLSSFPPATPHRPAAPSAPSHHPSPRVRLTPLGSKTPLRTPPRRSRDANLAAGGR